MVLTSFLICIVHFSFIKRAQYVYCHRNVLMFPKNSDLKPYFTSEYDAMNTLVLIDSWFSGKLNRRFCFRTQTLHCYWSSDPKKIIMKKQTLKSKMFPSKKDMRPLFFLVENHWFEAYDSLLLCYLRGTLGFLLPPFQPNLWNGGPQMYFHKERFYEKHLWKYPAAFRKCWLLNAWSCSDNP